jgi:senataxin
VSFICRKLQSLDKDLHWFCPRRGTEDGSLYYDEDVYKQIHTESEKEKEERHAKIAEVEDRRKLILHKAIQIFAFDGAEAAPYQKWMEEKLDWHMTTCDVCIRIYHKSQADIKDALLQQYDDAEQVDQFMQKLDSINITRICKGLDHLTEDLLDLPPAQRNINGLDPIGLYALFEALSCPPLLKNEDLLQKHFDQPFRLIQSNKPLRLPSYNPAMGIFLFDTTQQRNDWAYHAFSKLRRPVLEGDFEWFIKDALKSAMLRCVEQGYLPIFWHGVSTILMRMDPDVIRNCIYSMDPNICRLALDHLNATHDEQAYRDIVGTIDTMISKSPNDYWDAMGTISPNVVVEQIFGSPALPPLLLQGTNENGELDALFGWVRTFLASIRPVNLPPACRALIQQFTGGLMMDARNSKATRFYSWKAGLDVLVQTLERLTRGRRPNSFVGRAICTDIFEVIISRLNHLLREIHTARTDGVNPDSDTAQWVHLTQRVIYLAIELDCVTLSVERELITQKKPLGHVIRPQSAPIWQHLIKSIKPGDIEIVSKALDGALTLCGLGKFVPKNSILSNEEKQFNESFDTMSQFVCDLVEKASEFPDLEKLFESPQSCNAVMGALLSSHTATYQATVELFKNLSGADGRREALEWMIARYYTNFLNALSAHMSIITRCQVFDPTPRMIKVCSDVTDMLSSSSGILRSRKLSEKEAEVTELFWQRLWEALTTIFKKTEAFSAGRDKTMMMDYCRDTMEFAGKLFRSYSVLANALHESEATGTDSNDGRAAIGRRLLTHPKNAMIAITQWLRLRDVFLIDIAVGLTKSILKRLHEVSIEVEQETLNYIREIITGRTRTKLTNPQLAELEEAVETHTGQAFKALDDISKKLVPSKQSRIDVSSWQNKSKGFKAEEGDEYKKLIMQSSSAAEEYRRKMMKEKKEDKEKPLLRKSLAAAAPPKAPVKPVANVSEFKRQRMAEKEAMKKRNAAAAAAARGKAGIGAQTNEAGSALAGLGVQGKMATPRGQGMMVSSESESESSDDTGDEMDRELFGDSVKQKPRRRHELDEVTASVAKQMKAAQPVRKQRLVRSAKDMRARLAPNLDPLLSVMLGWDYFHEGDFPPDSNPEGYMAVPNKLYGVDQYKQVFLPLLTLEAWQGFVKSREENTFKPFELSIVSRGLVDNFNEVTAVVMGKDVNVRDIVMESDIVLLSQAQKPTADPNAPHCLARASRVKREKGQWKVSFKVEPGKKNSLLAHLSPQAVVYGAKIQSLTPLEREYGALQGLQYYDLAPEICDAVPSPVLNYTDKQLEPIMNVYKLNKAQAKAVKSALDNDAFTLIQGYVYLC